MVRHQPQGKRAGRQLTRFQYRPSFTKLFAIFANALRG